MNRQTLPRRAGGETEFLVLRAANLIGFNDQRKSRTWRTTCYGIIDIWRSTIVAEDPMFASGILSSAQQNIASFQSQQQQKIQQQFQSLAQQFQSGGLSTVQTTALAQQNLPLAGSSPTPASGSTSTAASSISAPGTSSSQACAQSDRPHWHHRPHIHMSNDASDNSDQGLDLLGSNLSSTDPSSALQAYNTLGVNASPSTPAGTQPSNVSVTF